MVIGIAGGEETYGIALIKSTVQSVEIEFTVSLGRACLISILGTGKSAARLPSSSTLASTINKMQNTVNQLVFTAKFGVLLWKFCHRKILSRSMESREAARISI